MTRIVLTFRVGSDGVLHLDVPLGPGEADAEVRVVIEPAPKPDLTQDEWRAWVLSMAGAWQGEFERPEPLEYEQREELP